MERGGLSHPGIVISGLVVQARDIPGGRPCVAGPGSRTGSARKASVSDKRRAARQSVDFGLAGGELVAGRGELEVVAQGDPAAG